MTDSGEPTAGEQVERAAADAAGEGYTGELYLALLALVPSST